MSRSSQMCATKIIRSQFLTWAANFELHTLPLNVCVTKTAMLSDVASDLSTQWVHMGLTCAFVTEPCAGHPHVCRKFAEPHACVAYMPRAIPKLHDKKFKPKLNGKRRRRRTTLQSSLSPSLRLSAQHTVFESQKVVVTSTTAPQILLTILNVNTWAKRGWVLDRSQKVNSCLVGGVTVKDPIKATETCWFTYKACANTVMMLLCARVHSGCKTASLTCKW